MVSVPELEYMAPPFCAGRRAALKARAPRRRVVSYSGMALAARRTDAMLLSCTQSVMVSVAREAYMAPPSCAGRRAALKEGAPRRRVGSYSGVGLAAQRTQAALLLSCTQLVMVSVS